MKLLRFLLFPFAIIYDLVTTFRNFLFDTNIFKQNSFTIPVIVVGNLSVGGTGKTPQIEYLIRLLKNKFQIAVLSRGYKRKTKGFLKVSNSHSATEVGDEPLQFTKKFPDIFVAVDEQRVSGIQKILAQSNADIVLLDDAFQHRKVKGSLNILLTKFDDLFVDDFLIPTGNLRESRRGAQRANAIIITKCPENLSVEQQNVIKNKLKKYQKPIFFTTISYAKTLKGFTEILLADLSNFEVLLVTGIANPSSLIRFLKDRKINFQHLNFPDHHHFSTKDIELIKSKFEDLKGLNKIILTTEKDFVRLNNDLKNLNYLEIETTFLGNQQRVFDNLLINHINQYSENN
ncbi:tetraacyldisaccharide 4'-kinase [Polaribacter gangjinensis]|uniref:Tetraacyldisaccharide 4'-kinase n=1 Tax=Polaribacter gangjinensis TaxID=574710 RepID=A0A2S7W9B5_9FLAO|nr:tetraacyldisaccharide 4'-kinase [Polaribacter gangjinensis]PQJ73891.1 tetraacyldisaccharide 4'-kinase [Polaribacter gangjinensis]